MIQDLCLKERKRQAVSFNYSWKKKKVRERTRHVLNSGDSLLARVFPRQLSPASCHYYRDVILKQVDIHIPNKAIFAKTLGLFHVCTIWVFMSGDGFIKFCTFFTSTLGTRTAASFTRYHNVKGDFLCFLKASFGLVHAKIKTIKIHNMCFLKTLD